MRFFKSLIILLGLFESALFAHDMSGTWQGMLQVPGGRTLRIVIKISEAKEGALSAFMYSIDQGGQPIPINPITLQGVTVTMLIPSIGGSFEGELAVDGVSIKGKWKQWPEPMALDLKRATPQTAWVIPEPLPRPKPMAAADSLNFKTAMINPAATDKPGKAFMVSGRQLSTLNTTLSDLIAFAYGIHSKQIAGGPSWIETEKYNIVAVPSGDGQPNERQWKKMVQNLLRDRFNLAFNNAKRELEVYAITVGKNGPKLTRSEGNPNGAPNLLFRGLGVLPATNATMTELAAAMQSTVLDRPVVDHTGLAGRWNFVLTWTPDDSQFGGAGVRLPPPSSNGRTSPSLFTAFQEQLGLNLESTNAYVEVFIIERAAKPTENY